MPNSGGFMVTRTQTRDRFHKPPAVRRRRQQHLYRQQQQIHTPTQDEIWRPLNKESRVNSVDSMTEIQTDSDESTLSSTKVAKLSNLDRLMEAVTPFVPAYCFSEEKYRGWETLETDFSSYYCLSDLWECFSEWSAYGLGVPLVLNRIDSVKQYYVPYLSGIQLSYSMYWLSSMQLRAVCLTLGDMISEDGNAESLRETSCAGISDSETDRRVKGGVDGAWAQHNSQSTNISHMCSSSDEVEVGKSTRQLVFEYFEQEQPHQRKPLYDMASSHVISSLASQFPGIRMYRSSDLLPATGTVKNQLQYPASSSRKVIGVDESTNIPLPVFGLASYKLKGSILTPVGGQEWQQASSLLQAADHWLQCLQVQHPDFHFFVSHNSQRR
ncbi:Detected protein of unknown function [Hibiscus syriacus]|uniref:Uncharacterized protein n=1 Tax=Hibiscus syriacus TaxID=106335 RepID=A0A6A2ZQ92_HIBSY|nr:Detected protein of unknown function [Hibiscus syriacus]